MNNLEIDQQIINYASAPYIIAEAGVHHYNSVQMAKTYILEAKIAGADAIKFQTYSADRLAAKWAPTYWDSPEGQTQYDIFANRSRLAEEDYQELFDYAHEVGITLLSTPFDPDAAALLARFEMAAYKIASADLTYFPLLEAVAQFSKPVLLSTGAATFTEIARTAEFLEKLDVDFVLLHCVLSYPTPLKDANLQRITALREQFPHLIIGYSDHTQPQDSMLACPLAVGLGARVIEKHFTLNKYLDGDDHYHAVDPEHLKQLVKDCREAALMTGQAQELKDTELPARTYARRSIVAARPLKAGTVISREDIDFKRPGTGLSPARVAEVLGKQLVKAVDMDELLTLNVMRDPD